VTSSPSIVNVTVFALWRCGVPKSCSTMDCMQ
jgi:hypothetical protein